MLNKTEAALLAADMQYGGGAPDGSLVRMLGVYLSQQEDIVTPLPALKNFFSPPGNVYGQCQNRIPAGLS